MVRVYAIAFVLVILALGLGYLVYRLVLAHKEFESEESRREHERRMAREDRDYDDLMTMLDDDRDDGDP